MPSDLRVKIREHKAPLSVLFVLNMSESMVSSLDNVSKTVLSLYRTASRKQDKVGLVVFKGSEVLLLQHPTRNLRQVVKKLLGVSASDFTFLAAVMMKALSPET
jgi:Mg-chelatase subunit ChlD